MSQLKNREFVIIGAGIGGLAVALHLARLGAIPLICEKAPVLKEIGGVVAVRSNATRSLQTLGLLSRVTESGARLLSASVHNSRGQQIRRWSLPTLTTPTVLCRRSELQLSLLDELSNYPHRLYLGHDFSHFAQDGKRVHCRFREGQEVSGEAMIGADGLHSRVRRQIVGAESPCYRGYVQWRGILTTRHPVVRPNEKMEWWGRGRRFGVNPLGREGMAWYVSVNSSDPRWDGGPDPHTYFAEIFRGWTLPVREVLAEVRLQSQASPSQMLWTSVQDRPHIRKWGQGRVIMLGDAAHAPTPDLGMGATMAIEDAEALVGCLLEQGDAEAAFSRFESLRRPKARSIGWLSRFTGGMTQWANPVLVALRDALVQNCPECVWQRRLRRTYL